MEEIAIEEKTRIINAIEKLKKDGFNSEEDKAIFRLKDGTMEIYLNEDKDTIKTEIHDINVFVSDDLKDLNRFEILNNMM